MIKLQLLFYVSRVLSVIIRLEIIAKRGIIGRLSYNTSFQLYEKVDFLTFLIILAATQTPHAIVSCTYFRSQSKVIFTKTSAKSDPPLW